MKPALVLTLSAALAGTPALSSDLVGAIVPPYPDGFESHMGTCLPGPGSDDICAYSISTLNRADGAVVALLGSRLSHRNAAGEAFWETLDVAATPLPADGEIWAIELCYRDGVVDPGTVGIVTYRDAGGWIETGETVWAIRFDVEAGRFTELALERVVCVLPGS